MSMSVHSIPDILESDKYNGMRARVHKIHSTDARCNIVEVVYAPLNNLANVNKYVLIQETNN